MNEKLQNKVIDAKANLDFKCPILGLRQFLATESSLKLMRNAF